MKFQTNLHNCIFFSHCEGTRFFPNKSDLKFDILFICVSIRGGLIFWADSVGAPYIAKRLEAFAQMLPAAAGFYAPCEYLKRCAAEGKKLSGNGMAAAAKL